MPKLHQSHKHSLKRLHGYKHPHLSAHTKRTLSHLGMGVAGITLFYAVILVTMVGIQGLQGFWSNLWSSSPIDIGMFIPLFTPQSSAPTDNLSFRSFTDIFSGDGYINTAQTTLYRNNDAMAFTYPPAYTWQQMPVNTPPPTPDTTNAPACINTHCAIIKNGILTLDGRAISLPQPPAQHTFLTVSALTTHWIVGETTGANDTYIGHLYALDNTGTITVIKNPDTTPLVFHSSYAGIIGAGGSDDNWIALYGGYMPLAFHEQNNTLTDISSFFTIRMMGQNGFASKIITTGNGTQRTWYMYSATDSVAKLIKLFQNDTPDIQGAFDYSSLLFNQLMQSAHFSISAQTPYPTLTAYLTYPNHTTATWQFIDKGFSKTQQMYRIVSNDVHGGDKGPLVALLTKSSVTFPASDVGTFFVSLDGNTWQPMSEGQKVQLSTDPLGSSGKKLFWKLDVFPHTNDPMSSLYDKLITLNFWVSRD